MQSLSEFWLVKLLTIAVYILKIMAFIIMLVFVFYESTGYAWHYRTLINQLCSYLYSRVSRLMPKNFYLLKTHLKAYSMQKTSKLILSNIGNKNNGASRWKRLKGLAMALDVALLIFLAVLSILFSIYFQLIQLPKYFYQKIRTESTF